jgi:hypothetical protein
MLLLQLAKHSKVSALVCLLYKTSTQTFGKVVENQRPVRYVDCIQPLYDFWDVYYIKPLYSILNLGKILKNPMFLLQLAAASKCPSIRACAPRKISLMKSRVEACVKRDLLQCQK